MQPAHVSLWLREEPAVSGAPRLAWSLWGLAVLLLAVEAAFAVLNRGTDVGGQLRRRCSTRSSA